MPSTVTVNSDLGESFGLHGFGHDQKLLKIVDAVNIACGFHAGDPHVMSATAAAAAVAGVAMGAHPGLPDLVGFGRRTMALTPDEVRDIVRYQVGALMAFVVESNARLRHVKAHGALYGMLARDEELMRPVAELAASLGVQIYGLAGTAQQFEADKAGAEFVAELYVDLDYDGDGDLVITRRPRHTDPAAAATRVTSALTTGTITAADGSVLPARFDTVCIHSDTSNCVEVATAVAAALGARERGE
jgi:UPF0271 protein